MPIPKGTNLKPDEIEYIRQNCLTTSDAKMADYLKRDLRTIRSARRKLGISKKGAGKIEAVDLNKDKKPTEAVQLTLLASQKLNEEERKRFYRTQFTNSLYYDNLKKQFTKEEIDFYLEEWGTLCLQFEDIVATEKRQIDELIKAELMGSRILKKIRFAEEALEEAITELARLQAEAETDPERKRAFQKLAELLEKMQENADAMVTDYQRNVTLKNNLLHELNARRKDRVDQLTKKGTTFQGIVQNLRDRDVRERQGKHMELVRLAKEKKKNEFRKPITYLDGTKDCILLDEFSQLPEVEVVHLEDMHSKMMEKYLSIPNAKILVIDDDMKRNEFFAKIFKDKQVDFATNPDKAIDKLNNEQYDFLCLDYDLGLDQKGNKVADHIIENDLCRNTDILVHSMNKTGSKDLVDKLKDIRTVEQCSFYNIKQTMGEKNGS